MKIILIILVFIFPLKSFADEKDRSNKNSISFNADSFFKHANESESLALKLAYGRQAMVLNPLDKEIRKLITETKQKIIPNQPPLNLLQKESVIDYISTKSFLPFYMEDYLLIFFGVIWVILLIGKFSKSSVLMSVFFILTSYLLLNKILVTYSRDGSLRIIKSFSDISKTEGITLKNLNVRVAQDIKSDVTFIVPENSELDVYSNSPRNGEWIKIGYENGRTGWVLFDSTELYPIVR